MGSQWLCLLCSLLVQGLLADQDGKFLPRSSPHRTQRSRPWPRLFRPRFSLPFAYTVLGPGREVVARVLLPLEMPCPNKLRITWQDQVQVVPVDLRAEPLVGLHSVWYTDGKRFQHLTEINYIYGNPAAPFRYEDRVCEARFVPNFLGKGLVAKFHLHGGGRLRVPMPSSQPRRYFVLGDTGLRVKATNDGWCAEERG